MLYTKSLSRVERVERVERGVALSGYSGCLIYPKDYRDGALKERVSLLQPAIVELMT